MTRDRDVEPLPTRVGHAHWDDHEHHGFRLYRDLLGHESVASLIALAITGHRFSRDDAALLDDLATTVTVAEPRIWPLKAIRVVSAFGRVLPGVLAANFAFESRFIGPLVTTEAAQAIVAIGKRVSGLDPSSDAFADQVVSYMEAEGRVMGFGVPFRPRDERVAALRGVVERHQRERRPYWSLAEAIWRVARERKKVEANISSATAALLLDLGIEPEHAGPLSVALSQNILFANAVEGARQAPAILRRLPESAIDYRGRGPRSLPGAPASAIPDDR